MGSNFYRFLQHLQKRLKGRRKRVKTPTVLQMEAVECGAVALGIILGYYGRIVPLAELRSECGVSRDGISATNIVKAARFYGLKAKGLKAELKALPQLPCPYIVFWNFNHFVVVEGFRKQQVYINDPATGPRTISFSEFNAAYTGVVLVMEPGSDFKRGGRKPSLILALWERLHNSIGAILYAVLAGFLLVVPSITLPVLTQVFVDNILIQGRQDWLRPLLLGMLIAASLQGILTGLRSQSLRGLKIKLSVGMSSRFVWHLLHLPVNFYDQRFAGEIANRVNLNDKVANILSGRLATTVIDAVMIIFYVLVLFQYDAVLTAIGIGFAGINVLVLAWLSQKRKDANRRLVQEYGKVAGVAIAGFQNIETLKASGLESNFFNRWVSQYTKAINTQQELSIQNQTLGVLPIFLSALIAMLILVVGGLRVMQGQLSIGMLVAFGILIERFLEPVNRLVNFGSLLQELEGDLERLDDVLRNPRQEAEVQGCGGVGKKINSLAPRKLQGDVELKNITFGYSPIDSPLIENFNLSIKPGQRVALVGGSGSGKSTIAKLICGLYQPWDGNILFDGKYLSEIPPQVFAQSVAFVEQDIVLFAGTVRDNLTLWDSTVSHQQLVHACQDAAIHDVVQSLPGGYDAQLTEGGMNLSGGQRQRLEMARALINNPTILVMDEANSALDAETERIIDQNLRIRGCTCLIVAHRLSTIRDCDEIIVLEQGKVVQRGTHEELVQVEGVYSQLVESQEEGESRGAGGQGSGGAREQGSRGAGEQGSRGAGEQGSRGAGEQFSVSIQDETANSHPFTVHSSEGDSEQLQGQLCNVKGNQPILLNEPDTVWVIQSGAIAVFVVTVTDGIPVGTRQYLFSSNVGDALFGISPTLCKERSLLAVPLEETQLLKVRTEHLEELIAEGHSYAIAPLGGARSAIALLDGWIQSLHADIGAGFTQNLANSAITNLNLPDWEYKEFQRGSDSLPQYLAQLHTHFFDYLAQIQQQVQAQEQLRFQAQEDLDRRATAAALGELGYLLQPNRSATPLESGTVAGRDTPLLVAFGAIAKHLGVTVHSSPIVETLGEQEAIEAIAQASQLRVRQVQLIEGWWKKDCGSILAYHRTKERPVALLPSSSGKYQLFDPVERTQKPVNARVAAQLDANAYTFYRPLPTWEAGQAGFFQAWKLLKFALQGRQSDLRLILWSGIAVTLLGMLTPQATAILMDYAIPAADRELFFQIGLALLAAAFGVALFQLTQGFALLRLESFADVDTQAAVWDRLLNLRVAFFRQYTTGDLESRVSAMSDIRRQLGSTSLRTLLGSLFALLNLALLFYYSWPLAFVACVLALVAALGTTISGILTLRYLRKEQELEGQVFGVLVQLINGVAKLRVAGAIKRAFAHWAKTYNQQLVLTLRTQRIEDYLAIFNVLLPTVSSVLLFWFAVSLLGEEQLSTGRFLAFFVAFGIFVTGAINFSNSVIDILAVATLWERVKPILEAEPEVNQVSYSLGAVKLAGKLALKNVTFRYHDQSPVVLEDVSLDAEPGEFIALVGPSGSGKSTILRLLLGFETPQAGQVYYEGQDLRSLDLQAVRRQLGVVLQNSRPDRASIFENIAGGATISMDEAWEAARMAGFDDDIAAMPMGMHTIVSVGGTNLSGGQRQRLMLARALVSKPSILLLDEATSFLDNKTQAIVSESLNQLRCTRVVIAHRLSTIRNADRIYVLDQGRVVQQRRYS
ncbi:MAG: NHLP family bacteriocin export ABC transporter peptidase/permease/ATPase subunit [Cyanobacteriota bacterium]